MYFRMMQSGTDLVSHYRDGLIVEKQGIYRAFSSIAVVFFACFPLVMLVFLLSVGGASRATRREFVFYGEMGLFFFLFGLMGSALFFPFATSYRLTLDFPRRRWTLERGWWRWQVREEGPLGDFASVRWGENSEFGPIAWLFWKDKRRGYLSLMVGDRRSLTAKDLAQQIAAKLNIPLTDLKRNLIT